MRRVRIKRGWLGAAGAVLTALLVSAPIAGADSMVVQPDGRIVLTGSTWPGFAALARLNSDGSLDAGFGEGGFVVDRRLPPLTALALEPDGRIVAGGVGGFQLSRYLPDGAPDPGFAGGGIGGTVDPEQPDFRYSGLGPNAIVVRPSGEIVVAGAQREGPWATQTAMVRRYDSGGRLLETFGRVPLRDGKAVVESHWSDLLEQGDGSLVGVGGIYSGAMEGGARVLLARFLPGSGTDYDASFGAGAGLVQPAFPSRDFFSVGGRALASSDGKLLVAGQSAGTFLLARLNSDGTVDSSFGSDGAVVPSFSGPADGDARGFADYAESGANALAVAPDGDLVLGGGTSLWSEWEVNKMRGPFCLDCPQPLLARFDSEGTLDPGFGEGGVLHLLAPDGSKLLGTVEEVVALPDGKLLVKGTGQPTVSGIGAPFVARLNADGSYDPGFGNGGLAVVTFPCLERPFEQLRREGCLPTIESQLRLRGLRKRRPALSLRLRPQEDWARIRRVKVTMPSMLRPVRGFRKRARVIVVEGAVRRGKVRARRAENGHLQRRLFFDRLGLGRELRVRIPAGAMEVFGHRYPGQKLEFQVEIQLVHDGSSELGGERTLTLFPG